MSGLMRWPSTLPAVTVRPPPTKVEQGARPGRGLRAARRVRVAVRARPGTGGQRRGGRHERGLCASGEGLAPVRPGARVARRVAAGHRPPRGRRLVATYAAHADGRSRRRDAEVGAALGVSEVAARMLVYRAVMKLREVLPRD